MVIVINGKEEEYFSEQLSQSIKGINYKCRQFEDDFV